MCSCLFVYTDKSMPKRIRRNAWFHRGGYLAANGLVLWLVFSVPRTNLWLADTGSALSSSAHAFLVVLGLTWSAYFFVQASDPGYVTAELLQSVGLMDGAPSGSADDDALVSAHRSRNSAVAAAAAAAAAEDGSGGWWW